MNFNQTLLFIANGIFAVSFLAYLSGWFRSMRWTKAASYFLDMGFLVLSVALFVEAIDLGVYVPVANAHQAMIFFAWAILLMFLFVRRQAQQGFGLLIVPLVFILLAAAMGRYREGIAIPEVYLKDRLFAVHTLTAFFSYAAFSLSFAASALYLLQDRSLKKKQTGRFYRQLPPLKALEHMVYAAVALGVPLMTITLATGMVWSKQTFGHFWVWDVKAVLAVLTWFLYLFVLYLRYVRLFRGSRIILHTFANFFFVLATFLGSRLWTLQHPVHMY